MIYKTDSAIKTPDDWLCLLISFYDIKNLCMLSEDTESYSCATNSISNYINICKYVYYIHKIQKIYLRKYFLPIVSENGLKCHKKVVIINSTIVGHYMEVSVNEELHNILKL